jgi:hypothetical protein
MRGFKQGSEAQMIATLHSTADQVAAPTLSSTRGQLRVKQRRQNVHLQLGSEDLAMMRRLWRRMMVVTTTLDPISLTHLSPEMGP